MRIIRVKAQKAVVHQQEQLLQQDLQPAFLALRRADTKPYARILDSLNGENLNL